jgi:hypothetical protein
LRVVLRNGLLKECILLNFEKENKSKGCRIEATTSKVIKTENETNLKET